MCMGILAVITFFGVPPLVDEHVLSWITSMWNARMQKAATILIGLSIFAYAAVYIYYAYMHKNSSASR